jgi:hypothetical protein
VEAVPRARSAIVAVILIVRRGFAVALLLQLHPSPLSADADPKMRHGLASVVLTFFARLGFGVLAFTGGDIVGPARGLPR